MKVPQLPIVFSVVANPKQCTPYTPAPLGYYVLHSLRRLLCTHIIIYLPFTFSTSLCLYSFDNNGKKERKRLPFFPVKKIHFLYRYLYRGELIWMVFLKNFCKINEASLAVFLVILDAFSPISNKFVFDSSKIFKKIRGQGRL
jgi:hypothetical protein